MCEITVRANGKINLSLNITGTQGGMHLLDSITASVDIADVVRVRFDRSGMARVRFAPLADVSAFASFDPHAVGENNSAAAAMRLLQKSDPCLGADIAVYKGIPVAGGLGGSSADAAAVLYAAHKAMPERFGLNALLDACVAIGSDVPVLLCGGGLRMRGVGDVLTSAPVPVLHLAIAHGEKGVTSREAYARFDALYPQKSLYASDTDALVAALAAGDVARIASHTGNALARAACALCPEMEKTLCALGDTRALATFVTGSGNCCCGLYAREEEAKSAAESLRRRGFAATAARTVPYGVTTEQESGQNNG